jgi:hypothetical protein
MGERDRTSVQRHGNKREVIAINLGDENGVVEIYSNTISKLSRAQLGPCGVPLPAVARLLSSFQPGHSTYPTLEQYVSLSFLDPAVFYPPHQTYNDPSRETWIQDLESTRYHTSPSL